MDAQVLFRSFCAKITQSTTATTSIVIMLKQISYKSNVDSVNRVDFAIAYNRSNGGVAFVFVENFVIKLDLESALSQNFLQVRNCIPKDKLKNAKI